MDVLYLTPYLPYPQVSGAKIRAFQMLKYLSRKHSIHLVALVHPDDMRFVSTLQTLPLASVWPILRTSNPRLNTTTTWSDASSFEHLIHSTIRNLVSHHHFDLIDIQHSYMMTFVNEIGWVPKVLNEHNIEAEIPRSFYELYAGFATTTHGSRAQDLEVNPTTFFEEWQGLENEQLQAWLHADVITVVSSRDRAIVNQRFPEKPVFLVPNGVDVAYFNPTYSVSGVHELPRLAFVGSLQYRPNRDALEWFFAEIWPAILRQEPDCALQVMGRVRASSAVDLHRHRNVALATNLEDIRPLLGQCRAMVVPLRIGGGTSLKVLVAMAAGVPVVSTSVGCRGLGLTRGRHVLIADREEEFARCTVRLLRDSGLCRRLAIAGRELVERRYPWELMARRMDAVYSYTIGAH